MAGGIGGGGGGWGRNAGPSLVADVNVTSLVDVAFVLLIIFMITAPIMQGGVDVQLPRAEARPIPAKEGMVVSVDREGRIFIDETRVSYNDFRLTFSALVQSRKPKSVYLRADRRVPYGDVVRVLAIIRVSGISDVGLVAEEEDRAP
jgi:biopolymer transport protein TolR